MPDVAEWFYARGEKQIGPVTLEALRELAVNGQLTPKDLVWRNGTPDWKPAGEERELFEPDDGSPPAETTSAPVTTAAAPAAPEASAAAPIAEAELGAASTPATPVAAESVATAPIAAAAHTVMAAPAAMAAGAAVMAAASTGSSGYAGPHLDPTWDDREGASESEMPIPTYLGQSTFCTLFSLLCGVIGLPFAIMAIVYAAQVGGKLAKGDLDAARSLSDKAKLWCRVSFWLSFALLVGSLYLLFSGAAHPGRTFGNSGVGQ